MALVIILIPDNPYWSDNFVFEGLALCQQAVYFVMILYVGGIYDQQYYDNNIKTNKHLNVCFNQIILFYLV